MIKNAEEERDFDWLAQKARDEARHNPSVDLFSYDEQLYGVLSLLAVENLLQTVKNMREETGIRGCKAWYAITREVAGRSGVRLEGLAKRVHHPKPITQYKDSIA